jgi:hypothetical protein
MRVKMNKRAVYLKMIIFIIICVLVLFLYSNRNMTFIYQGF